MRLALFTIALVILSATGIWSQNAPILSSSNLSDFRPTGDRRIWSFVSRDSTVGQLTSTVVGPTKIGGVAGIAIDEDLIISFKGPDGDVRMTVHNRHVVSEIGVPMADNMIIALNDQTDTLRLGRRGDSLIGFSTRNGVRSPAIIYAPLERLPWDPYMLDQLEIYLMRRGLAVGDLFTDSVLATQSMIPSPIEGEVKNFTQVALSRGTTDSAFVVALSQPVQATACITRSRRLAKIDFPNLGIKAYLDQTTNVGKQESADSGPGFIDIIVPRIPALLVVLVVFGMALFFFATRQIMWKAGYLAAGISAVVFWLVPYTQIPFQRYVIVNTIIPAIKAGSSIYFLGLIPALIAGLIQTVILGALVFLLTNRIETKKDNWPLIGAFCGAGFGLMEAVYLVYTSSVFPLLSYAILERTFILIFHVSAGLLLGASFKRDFPTFVRTALILIPINSLFRYLPVLAQQKVLGVELLSVLIAFVSLTTMFAALLISRRSSQESHHPRSSRR